jgi:hypothetical protein
VPLKLLILIERRSGKRLGKYRQISLRGKGKGGGGGGLIYY